MQQPLPPLTPAIVAGLLTAVFFLALLAIVLGLCLWRTCRCLLSRCCKSQRHDYLDDRFDKLELDGTHMRREVNERLEQINSALQLKLKIPPVSARPVIVVESG